MTIHHQIHQDRIDSGLGFEWDTLPDWLTSIESHNQNDHSLRLRREKKSHKGVSSLKQLKKLWAFGVDQDYLNEISELENLELLFMDKVTAKDFSGLAKLKNLKFLIIQNAPVIESVDWVNNLKTLIGLAFENCKNLHDIQSLSECTNILSLGIEGGMWAPMKLNSFKPLSNLINLEYLFLTNLKVNDGSLQPLASLKKLKIIQCANFYAKNEFSSLALALPRTRCQWFPANDNKL